MGRGQRGELALAAAADQDLAVSSWGTGMAICYRGRDQQVAQGQGALIDRADPSPARGSVREINGDRGAHVHAHNAA